MNPPPGPGGAPPEGEITDRGGGLRWPWGGRSRETPADRARRALVGLKVGPSRSLVLAVIGSASLFVAAIVIGYLTR